ncbi:MAG: 4Fe-4S dicluster domain-containing protein [Planctomycetaceae bacterium]|nr:4Fe-4S dicluster domain-containing protein [Planctomycetaceae bacterium]
MSDKHHHGSCGGGHSCGSQSGCGCSEDAEATRREFLRQATTVTLGGLSLTILPGMATESSPAGPPARFGFLVDTNKCIGAGKCLSACRMENDVPDGYTRTWVERYVHFKDGTVQVDLLPETGVSELPIIEEDKVDRAYFVPKLCNQCDDAPCNQVCPVHASITSPEGVELVDTELCIGCAYCVQACPYGSRFMNPNTGSADKCNWCYHRIMRDESPACVEACPVDARVFGRLDDPESEISKRLSEVPIQVLKEHLGTHPKTVYVDLSHEVI